MAPSSRDRISVDLRGLKQALVTRSQEQGVSPSDLVRAALATALDCVVMGKPSPAAASERHSLDRVRFSIRMRRRDADELTRAARDAGMTTGDFVAALVREVPSVTAAGGPAAHLAALSASCSELATLSRNLHHLTTLLRHGSGRAAQDYRQLLDHVGTDVRAHLSVAASVVAALQPLIRQPDGEHRPPSYRSTT